MKLVPELRDVSQDFETSALGATTPFHPAGRAWVGRGSWRGLRPRAPRPAGRADKAYPTETDPGVVRRTAGGIALALVLALAGCGYRPVYGGGEGARYEVVAGHYGTSSVEAVQAAVEGARTELGAAQALGSGYPRVVVEVLRVDERSTGIRSTGNDLPLSRGSEVMVVGRARVFQSESAEPSLDTGDISRSAQYGAGASPSADAAARSRAVRDAGRSLGKALGRALLGLPVPSEG